MCVCVCVSVCVCVCIKINKKLDQIICLLFAKSYSYSVMVVSPVVNVFCVEAGCQCYEQLLDNIQGICELKR